MKAGSQWINVHTKERATVLELDGNVVVYQYDDSKETNRWALYGIYKTPSWASCWSEIPDEIDKGG
jgi:hypothetical protein